MDHGALDVVEVCVVLERALEQPGLLAQRGDVRAVVVGEHLVTHDSISNLKIREIMRIYSKLRENITQNYALIT